MATEFGNHSAAVPANEMRNQHANYIKLLHHELNAGAAFSFALSWPGQDQNHESCESNGRETQITKAFRTLTSQAEFFDHPKTLDDSNTRAM